jgi:hypothetical protein
MFDWKIIVTLLIVLVLLAGFMGSTPGVSSFLGEVGSRAGSVFSGLGIDLGEKSGHNFTLVLSRYDKIGLNMKSSAISADGNASAKIDNGEIRFSHVDMTNFTGSGSASSVLVLNGSADKILFDSSSFGRTRIDMVSSVAAIDDARIQEISQDAEGEMQLGNSSIKFSGRIDMKSIEASMTLGNGVLRIQGTAAKISIPGAGVNLD